MGMFYVHGHLLHSFYRLGSLGFQPFDFQIQPDTAVDLRFLFGLCSEIGNLMRQTVIFAKRPTPGIGLFTAVGQYEMSRDLGSQKSFQAVDPALIEIQEMDSRLCGQGQTVQECLLGGVLNQFTQSDDIVKNHLTHFTLRPAFVGKRQRHIVSLLRYKQQRIRNSSMDQFNQPSKLGILTNGEGEHGYFQIFSDIIAVFWYANCGWLQGSQPEQLFDPFIDLALVGGGRCTVSTSNFLGTR